MILDVKVHSPNPLFKPNIENLLFDMRPQKIGGPVRLQGLHTPKAATAIQKLNSGGLLMKLAKASNHNQGKNSLQPIV
ncbi:hypothetical protein LXL04_038020 [Taraxacum kok-saghyz]